MFRVVAVLQSSHLHRDQIAIVFFEQVNVYCLVNDQDLTLRSALHKTFEFAL
jgi:hypothetical protein